MHVQLFFPTACFFNVRARGTKRGRRTVDDARPTLSSQRLFFQRSIARDEERKKDSRRCTSNFFPQRLFFQRSSTRVKERKEDNRRSGSSLPPRSNPEWSEVVAKYFHQERFTFFYMGHVKTLYRKSRYH